MPEQEKQSVMRSTATVKAVKVSKDHWGKQHEIVADLPIGRGWNSGNGFLDYKNLGWVEYDEYMAKKNQEEVEKKKAEEQKKLDESKKKEGK